MARYEVQSIFGSNFGWGDTDWPSGMPRYKWNMRVQVGIKERTFVMCAPSANDAIAKLHKELGEDVRLYSATQGNYCGDVD